MKHDAIVSVVPGQIVRCTTADKGREGGSDVRCRMSARQVIADPGGRSRRRHSQIEVAWAVDDEIQRAKKRV